MPKVVDHVIMTKNPKSEFIVSSSYGFSNFESTQTSANSGNVESSSVSFFALAVLTWKEHVAFYLIFWHNRVVVYCCRFSTDRQFQGFKTATRFYQLAPEGSF